MSNKSKKLKNSELIQVCELMKGQRDLIRFISEKAIRNSFLETLHSGISPSSKTGDYSDVKVVTPYGEIPWNNLSRFGDKEMRKLMLEIEGKLHNTFAQLIPDFIEHLQNYNNDNPASFMDCVSRMYEHGVTWDWKGEMKRLYHNDD